jgi:hypothetical protein
MRISLLPVSLLGALVLLAGCGSGGTRTVSVANTQSAPAGASAQSTTTSSSRTAGAGASGASGPKASGQGGPSFVTPGSGSGTLGAAEAVVQSRGYRALNAADYRPAQTLRVLIGARQGSADGHVQQAFFFVGDRYIGTDTSAPSAQIRVLGQGDTQVTLGYALYRPGDPLCCAGGGQATVTYQLDNGHLRPLNPIPSASPGAPRSRQ